MRRREFLSAASAGVAAGLLPTGLGGTPFAAAASASASASASTLTLTSAPRMADALCRNYMVNTKMYHAPTVYGHTDAVIELLTELGVRTVRERVTTGRSQGTKNQLYAMPRLARSGVRWHGTVAGLEDWPNAAQANKEVMDFLATSHAPQMDGDLTQLMHSFGGCNEIDGAVVNGKRDPEWAAHARMMQRALWEQAKDNAATRGIPVAGPSTRTDFDHQKAAMLGDLSGICELGNGHLYNKGKSPTGELDGHLNILQPCFPGVNSYIMTETGYNNSPQDDLGKTVPEFASAIYAVRGLCDFFRRDTVYGRFELLDDPDPIDYTSQASINRTADREGHFGLVAMTKDTVRESTPDTWRKKPEFHATRRLLGLLEDRGPAFRTDPFEVTVTGGEPDLQHLLLQKRDGRHYLLLWRDVNVCSLYPEAAAIAVEPARLTVKMQAARPIAIHAPNRQDAPLRTESARRAFRVNVRGDLKVVEIG